MVRAAIPVQHALNLRSGEWVDVRSADEILGTLDATHALDGLPFMPEMLKYCGGRYRVYKVAHKTCDTVRNYTIRRMTGAVHLEGLRCDGEAHAGCQAGCLFFWKEAWLKRVDDQAAAGAAPSNAAIVNRHWELLQRSTRAASTDEQPERFRCQATDLHLFTREVRRRGRWNPLLYIKDVTSGNIGLFEFIWHGAIAMFNSFTDRWFDRRYPHISGTASGRTPSVHLNLQPGDLVQVRSKQEIVQTLGRDNRNRGLVFDVEMVPYCGGTYRVLQRVDRMIDEKTGRLITMSNPCLILDGVTCSGKRSASRLFCPRELYPYWREIWLERAQESRGTK
jgi:hypothetical protein